MEWEYYTYRYKAAGFWGTKIEPAEVDAVLNEIGRQGWELVSVIAIGAAQGMTKELVMIFKRQR